MDFKKMKILSIIVLALLINSCAVFLSQPQIHDMFMRIKPGMHLNDAKALNSDIKNTYELIVEDKTYGVLVYNYITSHDVNSYSVSDGSGKTTTNKKVLTYYDSYYLVFENDELLYHGMIHEFRRHPNSLISKIGDLLH
jgi:hypothetical protein